MLPDLAHGQDIFGSPELRTKMKILHAVDKSLDRITIARRSTAIFKANTTSLGGIPSSAGSSTSTR